MTGIRRWPPNHQRRAAPLHDDTLTVSAARPDSVATTLRVLTVDDATPYEGSAAAGAYRDLQRTQALARSTSRRKPRRSGIGSRAAAILTAGVVGMTGATAAAYAGVLPPAVQRIAHHLLHAPRPHDPTPFRQRHTPLNPQPASTGRIAAASTASRPAHHPTTTLRATTHHTTTPASRPTARHATTPVASPHPTTPHPAAPRSATALSPAPRP